MASVTQKHGDKKIVYLDQNWLSDIAKAVRVESASSVNREYFTELYNVVLEAIADDKVVCPTAPMHTSESNFDAKRSADFLSVDNAISRGLSFNESDQISHDQLLMAASAFAGTEQANAPWWWVPFNRDPDVSDSTLPRPSSGIEVFVTVEAWVNEERRMRNQIGAPLYRKYKDDRKAIKLLYRNEVAFSRCQLFREGHFGIADALSLAGDVPVGFDVLYQQSVLRQQRRILEINGICDRGAGIAAFMTSDEFAHAPYLSIRAKLMAADIVNNADRRPEDSLLSDFNIAATVIPYVDVFATENYLAELLRTTRVDTEFECKVYTMRQRDALLDYLAAL